MHMHQDACAQVACVDTEDEGSPLLSLHYVSYVTFDWR